MKISILAFLLILYFPAPTYAQTYRMEVDYLNSLLMSHEKTAQEVTQMKKALDDACDDSKTYPVLPYDTLTKSFNFTFILDCPGIPKKVLFERTKEWGALSYADIEGVLRHENFESGKIIIKGYTPLSYRRTYKGWFGNKFTYSQTSKGYHTMIITVKEEKVKLEIKDIRFSFSSRPYFSTITNSMETGYESTIYLDTMFPITKQDGLGIWIGLLDLARQSFVEYGRHSKSLNWYLLDWEKDYKF